MITGLRRSSLYVPGDVEKMLRRASGLPADIVLFNLEDGVSASRKGKARDTVVRVLRDTDFGAREVVVRVNRPDSENGKSDIEAVVPSRPDGLCLPKVESAEEVLDADRKVRGLEREHGLAEGRIRLHAMIESARGVLAAERIAAASPRMASLIFGLADFVKDVGSRPGPGREEIQLALQQIVLAARSAGIDAIDAPCFELRNRDLLLLEAQQARRLGFSGKNALHPAQLETINRVFDVTEEEVTWARKVVSELAAAEEQGRALTTLDGELIDDPHLSLAKRILARAGPQAAKTEK